MATRKKNIEEICKATGISSNTVRKYVKEFETIVPCEREGAKKVLIFDESAVNILIKIKELYKKESHDEIVAKLSAKAGKKAPKKACAKQHKEEEPMNIGHVAHDEQDQRFW
jgi:DNA-binding transcriptional MerR regulator